MKKAMLFLAVGCCLVGCQRVTKVDAAKAQEIASQITYVKDSHGVCYATLGSNAYGGYIITSITAVSCDQVGL